MSDLFAKPVQFQFRCCLLLATLLTTALALPVFAAAPFTTNGDGTVLDTSTNLVWDQCPFGLTGASCTLGTAFHGDWLSALAMVVEANEVSYKGFNNWRLPNVKELESIVKIDALPPIDADAFPGTPSFASWFWSSTITAGDPDAAWNVDFGIGYIYGDDKSNSYYVRLVRSGQSLASFDALGTPADITPPVTTAGPSISSGPTQTGAGLSVTIDEAGTGYWLLVPASAAAPTPAQVAAGANYGAVTVAAAGSTAMTASNPATINLSGLTVATSYTLYFVAKDTADNLQAAVASVAVTTADLTSQTITGFAPTSPVVFGAAPATLSATGGASGQPVVFATTSAATICTVSGSTVTFTGAGTCNLTANQAASGNYAAAPQVAASISIVPAGQSIGAISFSPSTLIVGGSTTASASGGASGNPIIFSSDTPSICSVSGNTVAALLQGTCTISANQAGNTNYLAAPQVQGSLLIDPASVSYSLGVTTSDATGVVLASSTGHGGTAPYSLADLAPDTQVVLDAPANTGSAIFLGWTGCDSVSAYSCTLSMTAAKNVVAQYSALPPVIFEDDFADAALNTSKWRERRPSTGVISLTSGMAHLGVFSSAETCGKFAMSGDAPIVVEARFAGQGAGRDSVVDLMGPATSGADFIQVGDTSYQDRGLYGNAAGSFAFDTVSGGPTTTAFKEYRVTLSGSLLTIARGDTLDTLTETAFAQLPKSAAGTSFFLRIGTGSQLFSPADFDWIRVRGSHGTLHTGCPTDNLVLPPQTIEFSNPGGKTLGSGSFLLVATGGNSGNAVTFESQTPAVCAVLGNTTMLLTAGTCTITANQAGSVTFSPAAPVTQSFEVSKAAQSIGTISFSPSTLAVGGTTAANATASSGLTVAFSSTTPTICSVSGSTVTALAAGTCTVAADQSGNATFAAATQVTQSIEISKASQTIGSISFSPITLQTGGTTSASATANSGLPVSFTSSTSSICTVSGSTVTGVAAGTCTIAANQAGDPSFSAAPQVTANITVTAANPVRLLNIATRGRVETVDNVMIAGFIIQGSSAKKVLIRARGPSLAVAPFNVPGTLSDPFLTLYSGATPIDSNDDFAQHANAAQIPADWIPANAKEAAIVTTLNPGAYTAIVNGVGATSGVAIVEVFEIDQPGTPLINIATRGPVYTGDNVMIAGLIIQGDAPKTVLITARGPSMAGPPHNVPGTLANPTLTLYSGQTVIGTNDNWPDAANAAQIQTAIGAPSNTLESAILVTLQPGAYTAIVSGAGGGTGLAIVEVFAQ